MNWKQALANFGLTEETISQGLKTKIKDHRKIEDALEELQEQIQNTDDDDELNELNEDIYELQEGLQMSNEKLIRAIELYHKNKDKYAELSKNLGKGRPRKNPLPQQVNPTPTPTPTPQVVASGGQVQNQSTDEGGKKKKNSWGWIIGGLIIGGLTLGAVNAFKDR
jgi:hypothetical protein